MALDILFRDQWLVVIDKPAGMLVHPGREPEPADQIAMKVLRDQIGHRVSTIHRLDRPTSGVLLFGLDQRIEADLRRQFEQQLTKKRYAAVVPGRTPDEWTADEPLQKKDDEPFRDAMTRFKTVRAVAKTGRDFSLLEATPETGRYHQIRRHLAKRGFPIVGDYLYGDVDFMNELAAATGSVGLLLHARELTFYHPVEGIDLTVQSPLPERFSPFLGAGE